LKTLSIIMGLLIYIFILSCSNNITPIKKVTKTVYYAQGEEEPGQGGNPEVRLIHNCFNLSEKNAVSCLNNIFKDDYHASIISDSFKPILLAGRATSIDKRNINLSDERSLVLYLETSKVKTPLSSNVEGTTYAYEKNKVVVLIPVQNINEKVILKDANAKLLLEYELSFIKK